MKVFPQDRSGWLRVVIAIAIPIMIGAGALYYMTSMPGRSYSGALPPLAAEETITSANMRKTVDFLAGTVGDRNMIAYQQLQTAAAFIESRFKSLGYEVESQEFTVQMRKVRNISVEIRGEGKREDVVVVGAHYDTVFDCPGADDNTSGVAALLELARLFKFSHPRRTLRFVAFVNEEYPWFKTDAMGSLVYAKRARQRNENIVAMISLETIGMYSDVEGSQRYPEPMGFLYPRKANFIGFVGNLASRGLVRQAVKSFRRNTQFPSEGSAAPAAMSGVGWSDHWSFWEQGYSAIMVTDTALFRNPNYHRPTDKPETLDYDRMAQVVTGLEAVVKDLAALVP
jgi:Zn-dependent M28 family amino/carboxypeptidase